jgi:hypothetical protein
MSEEPRDRRADIRAATVYAEPVEIYYENKGIYPLDFLDKRLYDLNSSGWLISIHKKPLSLHADRNCKASFRRLIFSLEVCSLADFRIRLMAIAAMAGEIE